MRRGDLSVVNVNVHKGELSSMRTGDTASYLLHDFFPLVFFIFVCLCVSSSSSSFFVCFFMLIFCYF